MSFGEGRARRERILAYLVAYSATHGWMPTFREIATEIGTSPSIVQHHLRRLERDGRIVLGGGPRMIRVL